MIQVFDVLGKDSNPNINSFKDELYIFNIKIDKYKIDCFDNKIVCLKFGLHKNDTLEILDNLIKLGNFERKFITKDKFEETEWSPIEHNAENGFTEWKTKHFEFDKPAEFEIDNIEKYTLMTFRSQNENILIREEIMEKNTIYVFEIFHR